MGTDMDFKSFSSNNPQNGGGSKPLGNMSLTRQQSIYSLTFDEFQSTMGGLGKDFGSMNMDELLKSIWSAEETQTMASATGIQEGTSGLQRQGSLTLPRTLSQKTVDEVWRDISKEYAVGKDGGGTGVSNMLPQRQQTLGEMTLEEFLVRAGVVREETQLAVPGKVNNGGFFGDLQHPVNNLGFGIGLQQGSRGPNLMGNRFTEGGNQIAIQSSNLPSNVNGVRSNQHPLAQQQQQQMYPKQPTVGYATQMNLQSGGQLGSPGIRGGIAGTADQGINSGMIQGSALQGGGIGMIGLGGPLSVGTGSPASQISSDGIGKSSGDTSSVSPVPYAFNGGLRGRKSGALEKAIERRQRRMIKNRESAARSRARKQAYTMELEAEVAKLKEENQELRKRQAEIMEMQKNQAMEMNMQPGGKKRCLRRTQTGPW